MRYVLLRCKRGVFRRALSYTTPFYSAAPHGLSGAHVSVTLSWVCGMRCSSLSSPPPPPALHKACMAVLTDLRQLRKSKLRHVCSTCARANALVLHVHASCQHLRAGAGHIRKRLAVAAPGARVCPLCAPASVSVAVRHAAQVERKGCRASGVVQRVRRERWKSSDGRALAQLPRHVTRLAPERFLSCIVRRIF